MQNEIITQNDLVERVALPMGNLSKSLEALLRNDFELTEEQRIRGLRLIQANAEQIFNFVVGLAASTDTINEPKTPDELRRLIAKETCKNQKATSIELQSVGAIR